MKTKALATIGVAAATILTAGTTIAGPVQRAQVSANADWVMHMDLDQLKKTNLGQFLLDELDKPEARDKLASFQAIFNFDPRRNIQGLTLYGQGTAPADAILLVQGKFDADRLVTLAKGADDYESHSHRSYTIHSWVDKKKKKKDNDESKPGRRTYGAIHSSGAVVFGQKQDRVAQALDVLDDLKPSLQSKSLLADLGPSPAVFQAATQRPQLPAGAPNAAILRRSRSIRLNIREVGPNMVVELHLQADNEEGAVQIESVAQGLITLLAMQTDNPDARRLGEALSLVREGPKIIGTLKLPSQEIIERMQQQAERKAARR